MAKANVSDVALFFIALAQDAGEQLTHMKLQKLIYYAQAWHLGVFGVPLFNDRFEAWEHGPVCPEIYHQYKQFGQHEIPFPDECDSVKGCTSTMQKKMSPDVIVFLNSIADDYMNFTAYQLRGMTHKEQPWIDAAPSNGEISIESMCKYFGELVIDEDEMTEIEAAHRAINSGDCEEWKPGMFN